MQGKLRFLLAVLTLSLLLPALAGASMGGGKMLKPGTQSPDFSFQDIGGLETSLSGWAKDKPVLLVFIQTACGSCQREMQFLKEFNYKEAGLEILVLFIDVKEMDFKAYVKDNALPFRFAWDSKYAIADAFGVSFAPASFLLDKEHKVAKVYRGWSKAGEEILQDIKEVTGK